MKVETKNNLIIFLSGMLVAILVVCPGVYFIQKVKYEKIINKVYSFTPQIVYRKPQNFNEGFNKNVSSVYYGDWFDKYKNYPHFNYFRAFNKDYLVPLKNKDYSEVQGIVRNQLVFVFSSFSQKDKIKNGEIPNYTNKCWFEQELKKYTDKNFSILNIDNTGQIVWVVDFETEVTKDELKKLEKNMMNISDFYIVRYNQILLPDYFKDYGRENLSKGGINFGK